jgi:sigma-B regulation protein RsbU (phosphoserine phosphatase)
MIDASTFPMGIMAGVESPRPAPVAMESGDIFALISDGVFEYIGPGNKQFGDDRVVEVLRQHRDKPMADLITLLDQAVKSFSHGHPQADDMTIVLLKRQID